MATATAVTGQDYNMLPGLKTKVYTITMDGAYAKTAGEIIDLSAAFPTKVIGGVPISDTDGWLLSYEPNTSGVPETGKIVARWVTSTLDQALFPEVDSGTDLTGVTGLFLFFGY